MKTYECIAHSGNTGKQIVLFVRVDALVQARQRFGPGAGSVTIIKRKLQ